MCLRTRADLLTDRDVLIDDDRRQDRLRSVVAFGAAAHERICDRHRVQGRLEVFGQIAVGSRLRNSRSVSDSRGSPAGRRRRRSSKSPSPTPTPTYGAAF